ncbi:hypothetical protein G3R49_12390 [Shewanella sp. WXL01]|uniref:hypothetical protein n=1 Tax=Shewanella sp. WXL01 TaxID=2709721 RepID=UPI0014383491|nr:hypothetical protein [Shewanella sp. WXL01]NKF51356.1 hypothetical protein [Shewanella sp. WXL01]
MALVLPSITLASGITLTNALAVISELNVSNNTTLSERVEVIDDPSLEKSEPSNEYQLSSSTHGSKLCTFFVSIFMSEETFANGKPEVERYHEGRDCKCFSVSLLDDKYTDMTPRQAAYAYLQAEVFTDATEAEGVAF